MAIGIQINNDGTATLYRDGKKVRRGDVEGIIDEARGAAPKMVKKEKPKSRRQRWEEAASLAEGYINELIEMQQEFQDWLDNLPENLQNSPVGEKLDSVTQIDLQSALDAVLEAAGADLPMGFGRD